jgi:cardiolipin synthase
MNSEVIVKLFLKRKSIITTINCFNKYHLFKVNKNLLSLSPILKATNVRIIASNSNRNDDEKNRIFTIPNYLTVGRIIITPVISYLMITHSYTYATSLFFLAGFTDFLDGYIARNFKNQKSYLGSILDPAADKIFIGVMTITLGICKLLPLEIMLIILIRDLALILSSIIVRFNLIDKPRSIKKFFDVKQSSVQIEASKISKLNTFLQICLVGFTIPSELFAFNDSIYLKAFQYLTASTTIISGLQYLLNKGSYKVVK